MEPRRAAVHVSDSMPDRLNASQATQWFAPVWTMLPLAARCCLVRNPLNGASMELSSGEYAVLSACEGCRTLAEHEARAAEQLSAPDAHRPAFREVLKRCAQRGLLISLPDLVQRFGSAHQHSPPPLAGIVIRTSDRPALLSRLLQGAAALQARTGTVYRWHVIDDSRREESRGANRETTERCAVLDATYHELCATEALQAELLAAFPKLTAEIRLLLGVPGDGEVTYGRPINYMLLRFAGYRVLMLDDDVTIDPRRPALSRPGVEVSLSREGARWYENLDEASAACPALEVDPFAEHARWLGEPLAQIWTRTEQERDGLSVADFASELGSSFAADARVLFTRNHMLGDPGWERFARPLLVLSGETRRWLAAHPGASRYAFEGHIHWRGYDTLRLAPHRVLTTTTLTGFDNSVLMPPTDRSGRGEDVLLGEAARCVHPASWQVELPFALPHLRDAPRRWLKPNERFAQLPSAMLISYMQAMQPGIRAHGAAQRMEALGAYLIDLVAAGEARLRALLEDYVLDFTSRTLFGIHEQLDDASVPGEWKEILRNWLSSPLFKFDPASLRAAVPRQDEVRAMALRYGRTLIAWPQLWRYCRQRFA